MKLLLSLLLPMFCFAQHNFVKVTAFRIVDPDRIGHTVITGFIDENPYLGSRIQAVLSEDERIANGLLALKKQAKSWEKKPLPMERGNRSAQLRVPNMYVVQINRKSDTIYTTYNNTSVYFPDEEAEYIDPGNYLNGLLDEDLCFFAERNFVEEFASYNLDSIPASTICIKYEAPYGYTRKGFEKKIMPFQRISTDSVFSRKELSIEKKFWINNYRMKFEEGVLNTIDAFYINGVTYETEVPFSVAGIALNDTEEKLADAFPCSLEYKYWGGSLYDISRGYYYMVNLEESRGLATFYIKDKRVERIEVEFRK